MAAGGHSGGALVLSEATHWRWQGTCPSQGCPPSVVVWGQLAGVPAWWEAGVRSPGESGVAEAALTGWLARVDIATPQCVASQAEGGQADVVCSHFVPRKTSLKMSASPLHTGKSVCRAPSHMAQGFSDHCFCAQSPSTEGPFGGTLLFSRRKAPRPAEPDSAGLPPPDAGPQGRGCPVPGFNPCPQEDPCVCDFPTVCGLWIPTRLWLCPHLTF